MLFILALLYLIQEMSVTVGDDEDSLTSDCTPGAKHRKLKELLEAGMAQKRAQLRAKKAEERAEEAEMEEEIYGGGGGGGKEKEDVVEEDPEAELTDQTDTDEEEEDEEEEVDEEDEERMMRKLEKKQKKKQKERKAIGMLEDEAVDDDDEEEDGEEEDGEEDDDDDVDENTGDGSDVALAPVTPKRSRIKVVDDSDDEEAGKSKKDIDETPVTTLATELRTTSSTRLQSAASLAASDVPSAATSPSKAGIDEDVNDFVPPSNKFVKLPKSSTTKSQFGLDLQSQIPSKLSASQDNELLGLCSGTFSRFLNRIV